MLRAVLREDEIVPIGRSQSFDTHNWVIKQTEYGFRIWCRSASDRLAAKVLDTYERDEVAFVRSAIRPASCNVDVGANIGLYTALLATLVGRKGQVIACEPLESVAEALEHTLMENGDADRVVFHRVTPDERAGLVFLRHAPVTIKAGAAYLAPEGAPPAGHVNLLVWFAPTRQIAWAFAMIPHYRL